MSTTPPGPWTREAGTALQALEDAGARGWLHAVDIDSGRELAYRAHEPVVIASVAKVPIVLALYREADAGGLDVTAPQQLSPTRRSRGLTGLSAMQDGAVLSLRDLAYLALAVSDNAAADAVLDVVGLPAVASALGDLGLTGTRVVVSMQEMARAMAEADQGDTAGVMALEAESDGGPSGVPSSWRGRRDPPDGRPRRPRFDVLDPAQSNCSTAAETTRLLAAIWRDEAATPTSCQALRRLLGLQVWPHRLSAGFPSDDIMVSGKTGTLLGLRHEVGVVEYPDGHRYAVAIYTQSASRAAHQPHLDAAIGRAAHLLVTQLRLSGD